MHFSCFSTHPCFSILCAGAVNTRLYVKLCQNASERAGLAALIFDAQARRIRIFRLFALPLVALFCAQARFIRNFCPNAWSRPHPKAPFCCAQAQRIRAFRLFGLPWPPLAAPKLPTGPYRGPLGVLTASRDHPSRSSSALPVPPGALCDHTGCSRCFP